MWKVKTLKKKIKNDDTGADKSGFLSNELLHKLNHVDMEIQVS